MQFGQVRIELVLTVGRDRVRTRSRTVGRWNDGFSHLTQNGHDIGSQVLVVAVQFGGAISQSTAVLLKRDIFPYRIIIRDTSILPFRQLCRLTGMFFPVTNFQGHRHSQNWIE